MVSVVPVASTNALPPLLQASTEVKWVKPAPLWQQVDTTLPLPHLAEFKTDRFMPEFLDMMAGKAPVVLSPPQDATVITPVLPKDTAVTIVPVETPLSVFKLYQPLHQRFYLVTGSLVCRHLGLPDHTVDRKKREKTSFVIRRRAIVTIDTQTREVEQGWVNEGPYKGWHTVTDSMGGLDPLSLLSNKLFTEERLPLHPVKVLPQVATPQGEAIVPSRLSTTPSFVSDEPRTVYHGYVPVGNREKYLSAPAEDIAALIQDRIDHPALTDPPIQDPRLEEVYALVIGPWLGMYIDLYSEPPISPPNNEDENAHRAISLTIILNLGDFLDKNLHAVFLALSSGANLTGANMTQRQALLQELRGITLETNTTTTGKTTLDAAIVALQNSTTLSQSENPPFAPAQYYSLFQAVSAASGVIDQNYLASPPPNEGRFHTLLRQALEEEKAERVANNQPWLSLPDELKSLVKIEPEAGDVYYLRLVYERGTCPAVLSELSQPFTFAKYFDPVAPARPIRIELPSILPKDLRSYGKNRGVGLQMAPALNNLINRVNKDMLKGGPLSGASAIDPVGVTMICSFSISIIFLVAFIVMFIFLILLNIIFWWLAFIRICFPVPSRR